MKFGVDLRNWLTPFVVGDKVRRLTEEKDELSERERRAIGYIRRKINQLLMVMGTLPLRPEELDDGTLLELDPIGIISDSFAQVLEHLNETNEKLCGAQEEIQAILATAGVGIIVVDCDMKILAYNIKARELFFRDCTSVSGQACHNILCESEVPPGDCTFEKIMSTRIGIHQKNWTYKDRHYDVAGTPIKNKFGDITKVVLVYNDITDRKRTEDVLRESEEMYRNLFENANDLIQTIDAEGSLRYVNRAWCETLGYLKEEVVGLSFTDVIHPTRLAECLKTFERVTAGQKPAHFNTVFVNKRGEAVPLAGDISCSYSSGTPRTLCCIMRKIPA